MLLQVAGTTACRVTVHTYTQLRAELTAVVLAASTPLVVVGQVVLTLRGPHELLHVAARHEHDGVVEQVVKRRTFIQGENSSSHLLGDTLGLAPALASSWPALSGPHISM